MICLYYITSLRDRVIESSKMVKNILLLRDFEPKFWKFIVKIDFTASMSHVAGVREVSHQNILYVMNTVLELNKQADSVSILSLSP